MFILRTFILADNGERVFQIAVPNAFYEYLKIVDFNTKSFVDYTNTSVTLIIPKTGFFESNQTRGVLVDGFE